MIWKEAGLGNQSSYSESACDVLYGSARMAVVRDNGSRGISVNRAYVKPAVNCMTKGGVGHEKPKRKTYSVGESPFLGIRSFNRFHPGMGQTRPHKGERVNIISTSLAFIRLFRPLPLLCCGGWAFLHPIVHSFPSIVPNS